MVSQIVSDVNKAFQAVRQEVQALPAQRRAFSPQVEQWRSLVAKYFPADQVDNALAIINRESGGNPKIPSQYNARGTENSWGLFQINLRAHPLTVEQATDPEQNVAYAAKLFKDQGWVPWKTSATNEGLLGGAAPRPPASGPTTPTAPPPQPSGPTPEWQQWYKSTLANQQRQVSNDKTLLDAQRTLIANTQHAAEGESAIFGLNKTTAESKIIDQAKRNLAAQGIPEETVHYATGRTAVATNVAAAKEYNAKLQVEVNKLKGEFDAAWQQSNDILGSLTRNYATSAFTYGLMASLPAGIISGEIKSPKDITAAFQKFATENGWQYGGLPKELQDQFDQIYNAYAPFVQHTPGASPEQVRQQVEYLARNPTSRRVAIGSISTDVIRAALTQQAAVKPPPGMTEQDVRNVFSSLNLSDPKVKQMVSDAKSEWLDFVAQAMSADELVKSIQEGIQKPDLNKKLSWKQQLANLVSTPAKVLSDGAGLYQEAFGNKAVGFALYGLDQLLVPVRLTDITDFHIAPASVRTAIEGAGPNRPGLLHGGNPLEAIGAVKDAWNAAGQGYAEWGGGPGFDISVFGRDFHPNLKLGTSIFLDPTTYFGFGVYPKIAGRTAQFLHLGETASARAFETLRFVEEGWNTMWNIPLLPYTKAFRGGIYTVGQLGDRAAIDFAKSGLAVLRATGNRFATTAVLRQVIDDGIKAYMENPSIAHTNPLSTFGQAVIKGFTRVVSAPEVTSWWERIRGKIPEFNASTLDVDGQKLLESAKSAPPAFTKPTDYMFEVARANGVEIAPNMTVQDIIAGLQTKADQSYEIMYHGTTTAQAQGILGPEGLRPGSGLTPSLEQAHAYSETASRLARAAGQDGWEPTVLQFRVRRSDLNEIPDYVGGPGMGFTAKEARPVEHAFPDTIVPTRTQLYNIQYTLDNLLHSPTKGVINLPGAADNILSIMGIPTAAHDEMVAILGERLQAAGQRLSNSLTAPRAADALKGAMTQVSSIATSNAMSGIREIGHLQGIVLGLSKNLDTITRITGLQALNRFIVRPWATSFLKFLNFAPWNLVETAVRAGNIWKPGQRAVSDVVSHWGDIVAIPNEFGLEFRPAAEVRLRNVSKVGETNFSGERNLLQWLREAPDKLINGEETFMSRWQQRIRAAYLDRTATDNLSRIEETLPRGQRGALQIVVEALNTYTPMLEALETLNPKMRLAIRNEMLYGALQGVDNILQLKTPVDTLEYTQKLGEAQDILDRHPELDPIYRNHIMGELSRRNGARWAEIGNSLEDGVIGETWQLAQDSYIAQLNIAKDRLGEFSKQYLEKAANLTEEQTYEYVRTLANAVDSVDSLVANVRSTTTTRAHELRNTAQRDALHEASYNATSNYLQGVEDNFSQIFDAARQHVNSYRGFDAARRQQLLGLIDNQQREIKALVEVRNGEKALANDYLPKIRAKTATWDDFYAAKENLWDHYNRNKYSLQRQYESLAAGLPIPGTIPPVQGPLTSQHVAALFATNPNDLTMGLLDASTVMPRERWIAMVQGRADGIASRLGQGTAETTGFTHNSVGSVYDTLIRESGLDPANLPALGPVKVSLEGIRQELGLVRMSTAINPNEFQTLSEIMDNFAAEINASGIHDPNFVAGYRSQLHLNLASERGSFVPPPDDIDPVAAEILGWGKTETGWQHIQGGAALEPATSGDYLTALQQLRDGESIGFQNGWEVVRHDDGGFITYQLTDPNGQTATLTNPQLEQVAHTIHQSPVPSFPPGPSGIRRTPEQIMESGPLQLKNEQDQLVGEVNKLSDGYHLTVYENPQRATTVFDTYDQAKDAFEREGFHASVEQQVPEGMIDVNQRVSQSDLANYSTDELRQSIEGHLRYIAGEQEKLDRTVATFENESGLSAETKASMTAQSRQNILEAYNSMREEQAWLDARTGKPSQLGDALRNIVKNLGREEGRASVQTFASIADYVKSLVYYDRAPLNLRQARELSMERARLKYEHQFTDYSNDNIFDAVGKAFFPFWTYESQRWPYLFRSVVQHPGLLNAWSQYQNYTDGGYVHIPFTDLSVNPFRGTVLMGGLRGLIQKYPDYYDTPAAKMFGPLLDGMGRYGFFPGLPAQLAGRAFGLAHEIDLPPLATTGVNVLVRAGVPGATALREVIYPSAFQDFNTVQLASKYAQEQGLDYSGTDIWRKIQSNIPLTPQEQSLWDEADKASSGYQALFEQTGLFKLDIEARRKANDEATQLISQLTGITPDQQDEITKNGMKLSDVVQLDPTTQKQIFDLDKYKYWSGLSTPLYPKGLQALEVRRSQYWAEVANIGQQSQTDGFPSANIPSRQQMERDFRDGTISGTEYLDELANSKTQVAARIDALKNSQQFKGIPITLEERKAYADEHGLPVPTDNPWDELSQMYYEITPTPDATGAIDWNAYFATVDTLIDSMPEPYKGTFLDFIHNNWTDTEKLYWQVNREYLRQYNNLKEAVLQEYDPQTQDFLRRYATASAADQADMREVKDEQGNSLVDQFNLKVRTVKDNYRRISPQTDAWLFFWDKTNKPLTKAAENLYNQLVRKYQPGRVTQ